MITPLAQFTEQILSYANQTFSVLHRKFLKQIWGDNRVTAKLRHNQTRTDWQNGTYEIYIPTRDNINNNLSYYHIAIQVQPYNSNSTKRETAYRLSQDTQKPLGIVESELLILIAPRQDKWGLVRGFKHRPEPGYFTAVFTNKSAEIVWKRVLDHIHNFIQKRMDGLMRSLGFETWLWKWLLRKRDNVSNILGILKRFSLSIRQSAETFVKLIQWFRDSMTRVLEEIGVQNVALTKTCQQIRDELAVLRKALRKRAEIEANRDIVRVLGVIRDG